LDFEIRRLGASGNSFETIVASGPNGAKPHHRPSGRRVERNELIVLDFGAMVDGYCSDMTRTVCVGEPSSEMQRVLDVVLASQAAGVAAVKAGVACADIDRACREVISAAGWGERFVHGTGHGVGLDIHEAPAVAATSSDTLAAGHVVTVEPGVYLAGIGGARIEDTVVVTDEGCWPVTTTPKDVRVVEP
jgi:Xaa-Pro aminopeptidase